MYQQHSRIRGFTLAEMMVVVAIIAVLAAITIATFSSLRFRANESASAAAVQSANKKLEVYKITNRFYPGTLSAADVQNSTNTSYQYTVSSVNTSNDTYCLTATTNNVSMFGSSTTPTPARGGCPGHSVDGVAPITNYVYNPSFESGLLNNGWAYASATGYAGSVSTTKAYNGTRSAAISVSTTTVSDSYLVGTATVPTAGTYYVSAYVYLTSAANGMTGGTCSSGNKDAAWYNGSSFTYVCYNRSSLNGWQKISATLTASAANTQFQLRFYPPVASGATMYVDAVMVSNGASNYADGNTSGWAWSGTANNSTSSGQPQ